MTDEPNPDPTSDDDADRPVGEAGERDDEEFDTEEAELVAYLDGELDEADARRVEARLSEDPQARAKANALKKTYDLLDYLPRPEPSATFASRTLDRIPTASASGTSAPAANGAHSSPSSSRPTTGLLPLSVPSASGFITQAPPGRLMPWFVGGSIAVVLALVVGYVGHAAVRTYLGPSSETSLSLEESRLIENLPLYAGVDDFDFLVRLADSEEFAPDADLMSLPGVAVPPGMSQAAAAQPWGNDSSLVQAFKALPQSRQDQLRDLDRKLYSQPPAERARLFQVLETYAVWLYRLEPSERDAILNAPSPALRMAKIHKIREHLWQQSLPAARREMLDRTDDARRAELIQQWKAEEQDRRRNWLLARKNWETIRGGRIPWPFDDDTMRQQVSEFVRTVLKVDGTSSGRLTPSEAQLLREARDFAEKNDTWLWYGSDLYHLVNKYPMLPEPIGTPIMRLEDLLRFPKKLNIADRKALRDAAGKWPEFALLLATDDQVKGKPLALSLGPARPGEFRPPIEEFLKKELLPKLSDAEKESLKHLEGKWPDYPRRMIELAKKHDLSVPGVTLPGSPKKWDATYAPPPPRVPKGS